MGARSDDGHWMRWLWTNSSCKTATEQRVQQIMFKDIVPLGNCGWGQTAWKSYCVHVDFPEASVWALLETGCWTKWTLLGLLFLNLKHQTFLCECVCVYLCYLLKFLIFIKVTFLFGRVFFYLCSPIGCCCVVFHCLVYLCINMLIFFPLLWLNLNELSTTFKFAWCTERGKMST